MSIFKQIKEKVYNLYTLFAKPRRESYLCTVQADKDANVDAAQSKSNLFSNNHLKQQNNMINYKIVTAKNPITKELFYYPHITQIKRVADADTMDFIEKQTTLTSSDITAAFTAMGRVMLNHLQMGDSINFEGLGIFRPVIRTLKTAEEADKVTAANIKGLNIRFRPSMAIINAIYTTGYTLRKVD